MSHHYYMQDWGDAYSVAANEGWSPNRAARFADDYATMCQFTTVNLTAELYFELKCAKEKATRYRETPDGRVEKVAA